MQSHAPLISIDVIIAEIIQNRDVMTLSQEKLAHIEQNRRSFTEKLIFTLEKDATLSHTSKIEILNNIIHFTSPIGSILAKPNYFLLGLMSRHRDENNNRTSGSLARLINFRKTLLTDEPNFEIVHAIFTHSMGVFPAESEKLQLNIKLWLAIFDSYHQKYLNNSSSSNALELQLHGLVKESFIQSKHLSSQQLSDLILRQLDEFFTYNRTNASLQTEFMRHLQSFLFCSPSDYVLFSENIMRSVSMPVVNLKLSEHLIESYIETLFTEIQSVYDEIYLSYIKSIHILSLQRNNEKRAIVFNRLLSLLEGRIEKPELKKELEYTYYALLEMIPDLPEELLPQALKIFVNLNIKAHWGVTKNHSFDEYLLPCLCFLQICQRQFYGNDRERMHVILAGDANGLESIKRQLIILGVTKCITNLSLAERHSMLLELYSHLRDKEISVRVGACIALRHIIKELSQKEKLALFNEILPALQDPDEIVRLKTYYLLSSLVEIIPDQWVQSLLKMIRENILKPYSAGDQSNKSGMLKLLMSIARQLPHSIPSVIDIILEKIRLLKTAKKNSMVDFSWLDLIAELIPIANNIPKVFYIDVKAALSELNEIKKEHRSESSRAVTLLDIQHNDKYKGISSFIYYLTQNEISSNNITQLLLNSDFLSKLDDSQLVEIIELLNKKMKPESLVQIENIKLIQKYIQYVPQEIQKKTLIRALTIYLQDVSDNSSLNALVEVSKIISPNHPNKFEILLETFNHILSQKQGTVLPEEMISTLTASALHIHQVYLTYHFLPGIININHDNKPWLAQLIKILSKLMQITAFNYQNEIRLQHSKIVENSAKIPSGAAAVITEYCVESNAKNQSSRSLLLKN